MVRKLRPMTAKNVDKWIRAGVRFKHLDRGSKDSVKGLMLDIRGKNAASWCLRYQLNNGPTRTMGLGPCPTFTLAQARERAKEQRRLLADKVDPLQRRRHERAAAAAADAKRLTFAQAADRWFDAMRPTWSSERHSRNVLRSLENWATPILGKLDVALIDTEHVLKVLQQPRDGKTLWTAHATTADRLRNNIKLILDYAGVAGARAKDVPNPARWDGHLKMVLPAPSNVAPEKQMPALPFARVPELISKLASRESVSAAALRFVIMTACRIGEATGARWEEIDFEAATWTVPASRMKAKKKDRKPFRRPLSLALIALLQALPREEGNPYLFIGSTPGAPISDAALRQALAREGHADVAVHGFRSSFSDWAHERTSHANHVIEISLAHTVGNKVERSYRRGDLFEKRRRLMDDWARYCTTPPAAESPAKVVSIAGARR
jgi:integrase